MSEAPSASRRGKQPHVVFLKTLDTITEHTIEPLERYHVENNERKDLLVESGVHVLGTDSRQEKQLDDMYGDLPVLREHQYGDAPASRLV